MKKLRLFFVFLSEFAPTIYSINKTSFCLSLKTKLALYLKARPTVRAKNNYDCFLFCVLSEVAVYLATTRTPHLFYNHRIMGRSIKMADFSLKQYRNSISGK